MWTFCLLLALFTWICVSWFVNWQVEHSTWNVYFFTGAFCVYFITPLTLTQLDEVISILIKSFTQVFFFFWQNDGTCVLTSCNTFSVLNLLNKSRFRSHVTLHAFQWPKCKCNMILLSIFQHYHIKSFVCLFQLYFLFFS